MDESDEIRRERMRAMRVLLYCSDLLPYPGLPTSGGGLRCWQLLESLTRLGHEVIVSMPLFTYLGRRFASRVTAAARADAWDLTNQDALIDRHRPQAVLFSSSWMVDRLTRSHDCLMLYDLHGPQLLEQQYKQERNVHVNAQVKIEKFAKAHFVTCAGEWQRHYFYPYLLLAGHDVEFLERFFQVVPIACHPELPEHTAPPDTVEIVAGGGFFPWQDPSAGLLALGEVLRGLPKVSARARIFGGSHGITGADDDAIARIRAALAEVPNIEFHDFQPRETLLGIYKSSSLALDLHKRNPERELAFTTRTVEYLWCGLPVIYPPHGELSQFIRDYDAGWIVDPDDRAGIVRQLRDIIQQPQFIIDKSRNARKLVEERLTYDKAITPLARFLANPTRNEPARPRVQILPQDEYHRLSRNDAEYQELLKSRALRAAQMVSSLRRRLLGG